MPLTFYAEVDLNKQNSYNTALGPFMNFFQILEENRQKVIDFQKANKCVDFLDEEDEQKI